MNYVVYKRLKHMRKIDIHCHIIPGLDDGAADLNESLEMLKIAWAQGFDTFIATPHYSLHYQNLCPEFIREQCSGRKGQVCRLPGDTDLSGAGDLL